MFHAARRLTSQIHPVLLAAAVVVTTTCSAVPGSAQTLPRLPGIFLDTTYAPPTGGILITVNAGGNLQAALDAAQPGDVITLEAGATFTGNFTLPNKSRMGWIIIRTSASDASLPPPGTRITPAYAAVLPKVVSPNSAPAIATLAGAHHYRLIGLEVTVGAGVTSNTGVGGLVQLGDWSPQKTLDQVPHDIILDRVYVHGSPAIPLRRGIALNSASTAVIDSYISDAHHQTNDAQAIAGWNGPGPFKIVNNYLEGSGENLIFGGADPAITNLVPSDIEIRGNHFFKPLSWKSDDPSYAGINWAVKNLFELKNAQRVLVDGNIFENNWVAAQNGFAILFTPRNQDGAAPWSVVRDVTFTRNIVRHSASAIVTLGTDTNHTTTQRTTRILVKDNVFDDIGTAQWGRWTYPGTGFLFYTGAASVIIDHNTLLNAGPAVYGDISANADFVYRNNISPYNVGTANYELCCSGVMDDIDGIGGRNTTGNANRTVSTYFPGAVFVKNVLAGGGSSINWPVDNFFPSTLDAVGFVDRTGGDYHLSATSLYKQAGTDGKDLGADIDALNAATACALDGACTSTPPPPSDTTPPTVSLTAPTAGSTVAGTVTVSATATDNVGVVGVQFTLDGANLGAEVTTTPFAVSWNTTLVPNSTHTITAVARDAAGNMSTSGAVTVTVSNSTSDTKPPVISAVAASNVTSSTATIGWSTDEVSGSQVEYGFTASYGSGTTLSPSLVTSHSQALSGLVASTLYHYRVKSQDAAGNLAASADFTFTTQAVSSAVAAYSYDEGAGTTAADASVNKNTATLSGASWSPGGKFSHALSFNGTNSYVESPDIDALTQGADATFSAWIFLKSAPREIASVFNKWSQTIDDEYLWGITPFRQLYFAWHTTGGGAWGTPSHNDASGTRQIPLNAWTHIAVVRSGATLNFYINGVLDASRNVVDPNPFRNGISTLRIGGQNRGGKNRFFNGTIDEVRIYNRALAQSGIQHDMTSPIGVQ